MRPTIRSRPQQAPKTGQKPPTEAKKRVWGIALARGGVTGRTTPLFPCTLRVPDRFKRVRDPNGTIWTTFVPPAGPGSEKFFGRGSRGSKFFYAKNFFVQKRYSLGPGWVLGPKNSFWTPLDPPKVAIWAHFTHYMAKMGFKNNLKTQFGDFFFCSK